MNSFTATAIMRMPQCNILTDNDCDSVVATEMQQQFFMCKTFNLIFCVSSDYEYF